MYSELKWSHRATVAQSTDIFVYNHKSVEYKRLFVWGEFFAYNKIVWFLLQNVKRHTIFYIFNFETNKFLLCLTNYLLNGTSNQMFHRKMIFNIIMKKYIVISLALIYRVLFICCIDSYFSNINTSHGNQSILHRNQQIFEFKFFSNSNAKLYDP